jgi:hypothetical protein
VVAKQPQQNLVVERHRPRIIAKGRKDKIVLGQDGQQRHSAGRCT